MSINGNASSKPKDDEDISSVALLYHSAKDAANNDDTLVYKIGQTEDADSGKPFRIIENDMLNGYTNVDKDVFDKLSKAIQNRDLDSLQKSMDNLCRSKYTKVKMLLHWPSYHYTFEPTKECLIAQAMVYDLDCFKYLLELFKNLKSTLVELQPTEKWAQQYEPLILSPFMVRFNDTNLLHYLGGENAITLLEHLSECSVFEELINRKNLYGVSPLLMAVMLNEIPLAERMVELGANIDSVNKTNESPIYQVVLQGHINLTKKMLLNGKTESQLDVASSDTFFNGHSIFYPAIMSGNTEMIKYLQGHVKNSTKLLSSEMKNDNRGPLENCIVRNNMTDLLNSLLQLEHTSSDDHLSESVIQGIFMRAVELNKDDLVSIILETHYARPSLKFTDGLGRGVLHHAVKYPKLLQHLLNAAEQTFDEERDIREFINMVEKNNCSALHYAAVTNEGESLLMLAKWSVRFNYQEKKLECDYILSTASCGQCASKVLLECIKYAVESTRSDKNAPIQVTKDISFYTPALNGRNDLLEYLLDIKVPVSKHCDQNGRTALHAAVYSGSLPTVVLITKNQTSLLTIKDRKRETPADIAAAENHHSILKYLFKVGVKPFDESIGVNVIGNYSSDDETRRIVVDEILKSSGIEELTKALHDSGAWLWNPKSATYIFNQYISSDESGYTYDFSLLTDYVLRRIIKMDECLLHPLVRVCLKEKMNCPVRRRWYILNACLYFAFLILLTTYTGLCSQDSFSLTSPGMISLTVFILFLSSIHMIKEMFQMYNSPWKYISSDSLNNLLEWTLYICTFVFLLPVSEVKSKSQIEAGAVAIFIAWINFIWFLKLVPGFGIYVVLTKKVFTSLLKVLPVVILFIVAFAMTFLLLRSKDYAFSTFPLSALTTLIMMGGEIDYRDVFVDDRSSVYVIQCVFLVLFFLVMSIVVMNVFVGLAVGDTGEMMKRSKAEKRLNRARFCMELEKCLLKLPKYFRPKPIPSAKRRSPEPEKIDFDKDPELETRIEEIKTGMGELKSLLETVLKRSEEKEKSG